MRKDCALIRHLLRFYPLPRDRNHQISSSSQVSTFGVILPPAKVNSDYNSRLNLPPPDPLPASKFIEPLVENVNELNFRQPKWNGSYISHKIDIFTHTKYTSAPLNVIYYHHSCNLLMTFCWNFYESTWNAGWHDNCSNNEIRRCQAHQKHIANISQLFVIQNGNDNLRFKTKIINMSKRIKRF